MNQQKTLIVNYHYCLSAGENPYLARTAVLPDVFDRQMEGLPVLPGEHGVDALVTFDDGTKDIARNAIPVLRKHQVPAILFVCSLPLMEGRLLNVTKIHLLQGKLGFPAFHSGFMAALGSLGDTYELNDPARFKLGRIYRYDAEDVREFKLLLNVRLPYAIVTRILDQMFDREFGSQEEAVAAIYMSVDEIRRAQEAGIRIGLHTHSHFMLGRLTPPEQEAEICTALDFFNETLGQEAYHLSYPYGVPGTWNAETKVVMEGHGIPCAYTLGREVYDPAVHQDRFEIPRFDVNDVFDAQGNLRPDVIT